MVRRRVSWVLKMSRPAVPRTFNVASAHVRMPPDRADPRSTWRPDWRIEALGVDGPRDDECDLKALGRDLKVHVRQSCQCSRWPMGCSFLGSSQLHQRAAGRAP